MDREELIQGFLKNTLTEVQLKTFHKLLKEDPEFNTDFEYHQDLHYALSKFEADSLKQHLKTIEKDAYQDATAQQRKTSKWYMSAAAVLLIGLTALFFLNRSKDFYNSYYRAYPNVYQPIVRSAFDQPYYQAFQAYENQNYSAAADEFKSLLQQEDNPNLRFYLSICQLELKNYLEAQKNLEDLRHVDFNLNAESQWYLALIYLKQDQKVKAKNQLVELQEKHPRFNKNKIAKIIESISQ